MDSGHRRPSDQVDAVFGRLVPCPTILSMSPSSSFRGRVSRFWILGPSTGRKSIQIVQMGPTRLLIRRGKSTRLDLTRSLPRLPLSRVCRVSSSLWQSGIQQPVGSPSSEAHFRWIWSRRCCALIETGGTDLACSLSPEAIRICRNDSTFTSPISDRKRTPWSTRETCRRRAQS
jgi:hypothetical protein